MEGMAGSRAVYTTPLRVQVWFLERSRDRWKKKCLARNEDLKRKKNLVASARRSRQHWREEARRLRQKLQELESQNRALRDQWAAEKKDGVVAVPAVS